MDPTLDPELSVPTYDMSADVASEFENLAVETLGFIIFYDLVVELMQDNE